MKILKMFVSRGTNGFEYVQPLYYCIVDNIPELTYEKIGYDYVGSSYDEKGNIISSRFLEYNDYSPMRAFAGQDIHLEMKDGSEKIVKDRWWDAGSYPKHGEFIPVGISTIEDLRRAFCFVSYNINSDTFNKMLDEYYKTEKEYSYEELREFVKSC